jgi:hypothetical protein
MSLPARHHGYLGLERAREHGRTAIVSYQILMYHECMSTRRSIQAYLAVNEVETRDRRAHEPVAHRHWQIIWVLAHGLASSHVAGWCYPSYAH